MTTRSKSKALATLVSTLVLCTILLRTTTGAAGSAPPLGTATLASSSTSLNTSAARCRGCQLMCTNWGVDIILPDNIAKFLICCIDGTQCLAQSSVKRSHHHLPKERLLFDYDCQATYWTKNGDQRSGEVQCSGQDACELIGCWICLERLANPDCRPDITFGLIGGISFLSFFVAFWLLPMICHVTTFWILQQSLALIARLLCCLCPRLRTTQPDEIPLIASRFTGMPRRRTNRNRSRLLPQMKTTILVLSVLTAARCAGAQVVSITAAAEKCQRTAEGSVCHLESSTTITLLPSGQPVRLLLRHSDERVLGTLEIQMRSLTLHCLPKSERWLRSYHIRTTSVKRCPSHGSCANDFCREVNTGKKTEVPELKEWSQFPGFNKCAGSCSFWWCGCPNPGASCLFYRPHVIANSETVYELISCPTWEHRMRTSFKLSANGNVTEEPNVSLTPGITFRWKDLSITPIASSLAPAPIMAQKFLSDGTNMTVTDDIQSDLQCATRAGAERMNCTLQWDTCPQCSPDHDSGKINCQCRDVNIEPKFTDPENRLPIQLKNLLLRNNGREIFSEATYAPVQLAIQFEGLRIATNEDLTKCHASSKGLTGCYSCHAGAHLRLQCHTDFGSALAYVRCSDASEFTILCRKKPETLNVSLAFNRAEVDINCSIECSGGRNPFIITGHLRYVPQHFQVPIRSESMAVSAASDEPCWFWCGDWSFDFSDVFWYLFGVNNVLKTMGILAVALLAVYVLLRLNPTMRAWKMAVRIVMLSLVIGPIVPITCHPPRGGLSNQLLSERPTNILRLIFRPTTKEQCAMSKHSRNSQRCMPTSTIKPSTKDRSPPENHIKAEQTDYNSPFIKLNKKFLPIPPRLPSSPMATLVSFIANRLEINIEQLGRALSYNNDRWNEAQDVVHELADRGYTFRTQHLFPPERNYELNGTELTREAANRLRAFNRTRGPSVAALYHLRHGITLRYPTAPCLIQPGGNQHQDYFPLELVRAIPPSNYRRRKEWVPRRPSRPRAEPSPIRAHVQPEPRFTTTVWPGTTRPRPSHFPQYEDGPDDPTQLSVQLSVNGPSEPPRMVRRLAPGQTLRISGPLTLRVYTGVLFLGLLSLAAPSPLPSPTLATNDHFWPNFGPPAPLLIGQINNQIWPDIQQCGVNRLRPSSIMTNSGGVHLLRPATNVTNPDFGRNITGAAVFKKPSASSPHHSPPTAMNKQPTTTAARATPATTKTSTRPLAAATAQPATAQRVKPPSATPARPTTTRRDGTGAPKPRGAAPNPAQPSPTVRARRRPEDDSDTDGTARRAKTARPRSVISLPPNYFRRLGPAPTIPRREVVDVVNVPTPAETPPEDSLTKRLHTAVARWADDEEKWVHHLQDVKMQTTEKLAEAFGKVEDAMADIRQTVTESVLSTLDAVQKTADQRAVSYRSLRRALEPLAEDSPLATVGRSADGKK